MAEVRLQNGGQKAAGVAAKSLGVNLVPVGERHQDGTPPDDVCYQIHPGEPVFAGQPVVVLNQQVVAQLQTLDEPVKAAAGTAVRAPEGADAVVGFLGGDIKAFTPAPVLNAVVLASA
jgi:hypothetical protein